MTRCTSSESIPTSELTLASDTDSDWTLVEKTTPSPTGAFHEPKSIQSSRRASPESDHGSVCQTSGTSTSEPTEPTCIQTCQPYSHRPTSPLETDTPAPNNRHGLLTSVSPVLIPPFSSPHCSRLSIPLTKASLDNLLRGCRPLSLGCKLVGSQPGSVATSTPIDERGKCKIVFAIATKQGYHSLDAYKYVRVAELCIQVGEWANSAVGGIGRNGNVEKRAPGSGKCKAQGQHGWQDLDWVRRNVPRFSAYIFEQRWDNETDVSSLKGVSAIQGFIQNVCRERLGVDLHEAGRAITPLSTPAQRALSYQEQTTTMEAASLRYAPTCSPPKSLALAQHWHYRVPNQRTPPFKEPHRATLYVPLQTSDINRLLLGCVPAFTDLEYVVSHTALDRNGELRVSFACAVKGQEKDDILEYWRFAEIGVRICGGDRDRLARLIDVTSASNTGDQRKEKSMSSAWNAADVTGKASHGCKTHIFEIYWEGQGLLPPRTPHHTKRSVKSAMNLLRHVCYDLLDFWPDVKGIGADEDLSKQDNGWWEKVGVTVKRWAGE